MTDKNSLEWIADFIKVGVAAWKNRNAELSLEDLFPPEFIAAHSKFESIESLLAAAADPDRVVALDSDAWDEFVADNTDFDGWEAMRKEGVRQWKYENLELHRLND